MLRVSGRAIVVNVELTWQHLLSEFHPKQTRAVRVNRFHLSLWASMAARMITSFTYVAIIATSCVPLITSFLPPLVLNVPNLKASFLAYLLRNLLAGLVRLVHTTNNLA